MKELKKMKMIIEGTPKEIAELLTLLTQGNNPADETPEPFEQTKRDKAKIIKGYEEDFHPFFGESVQ